MGAEPAGDALLRRLDSLTASRTTFVVRLAAPVDRAVDVKGGATDREAPVAALDGLAAHGAGHRAVGVGALQGLPQRVPLVVRHAARVARVDESRVRTG